MRCFIAGFSKTTMPKKTTMKPKGPSQEGDPSWHHAVRSADDACTRAKQIAWTVISILPISMFFALFAIFGGFSRTSA
mgnify:CR=1 FL=1